MVDEHPGQVGGGRFGSQDVDGHPGPLFEPGPGGQLGQDVRVPVEGHVVAVG
jgi:hypothetical protein